MKTELGPLYVADKDIQNLNVYRMRQTRRFKELKLKSELVKRENTAIRLEVEHLKDIIAETKSIYLSKELDYKSQIADV